MKMVLSWKISAFQMVSSKSSKVTQRTAWNTRSATEDEWNLSKPDTETTLGCSKIGRAGSPGTRSGIKIGIVTGGLATVMETPTNRILRESRGLVLFKKSNEIKIASGSSKF